MSNYTTQIRFICENLAGETVSQPLHRVNEVIENSWRKIFGNFPIFREEYRETLCKKILLHFYQEEIGQETEGDFILRLNIKLNEIMPYYNKLYESELLDFDPFENTNMTESYISQLNANENQTGSSNSENSQNSNYSENSTNTETSTNNVESDKNFGGEERNTSSITREENSRSDSKETVVGDIRKRGDSGSTSKNSSLNKFSDTPEGTIENLKSGAYLTDVRIIEDSGETTNQYSEDNTDNKTDDIIKNGNTNSTENSTNNKTVQNNETEIKNESENSTGNLQKTTTDKKISNSSENLENTTEKNENNQYLKKWNGFQGMNQLEQLKLLRDSFLNIDMMIIKELEILFIGLY